MNIHSSPCSVTQIALEELNESLQGASFILVEAEYIFMSDLVSNNKGDSLIVTMNYACLRSQLAEL